MDENKINEKYRNEFVPKAHFLGRSTMAAGALISFLPVLFLIFVRGYMPPWESFVSVIIAVVGYAFAMWLTEPLSYFPILGASGTYMAYLAGNVSNMRAPVALSVQSSLDANIETPKGQMATIIAIATSVYVNLVILLAIVLAGTKILNILPPAVTQSLSYVLPAVFGSSIVIRLSSAKKIAYFYLPFSIAAYYISRFSSITKTFGVAISVVMCIAAAYGMYKYEETKESE